MRYRRDNYRRFAKHSSAASHTQMRVDKLKRHSWQMYFGLQKVRFLLQSDKQKLPVVALLFCILYSNYVVCLFGNTAAVISPSNQNEK